jgi:hypothetical protein
MRQAISYEMLMMLVGPSGATRSVAATDFAKLDFIQSYDFSFNVDRSALKQLGTGIFATRQTQLAPDVNLNFEYYLNDGWNENFIGLNVNSGSYVNPFADIFNFNQDRNFYVLISPDNGRDANSLGLTGSSFLNNPKFNDFNLLGIGNAYISNFEISIAVNQLAKVNTSFVAANARIDKMNQNEESVNLLYVPAVFTTGTGATVNANYNVAFTTGVIKNGVPYFRDRDYPGLYKAEFNGGCPYSACTITSTAISGSGITFGLDFENFQSMTISVPFERKSLYGFGGNHPFYRKIQEPVVGTFNLDSLVDSFQKQNLVTAFSNEDKTVSGYNFDIMFSNFTGRKRFGVRIQNARLDSYSIGSSIGDRSIISTSWSFEVNDSTGISFSGSFPTPTLVTHMITDSFNTYSR